MINLHCHSILSDGALLPSELAIRHMAAGYKLVAITDHADYSNIDFVINSILKFTKNWPKNIAIKVLPGIELTHLPLNQYAPLVKYARKKGIKIIVGHGESPVEPVISDTNKACIEAKVDILAHPGQITEEDVLLAKKNGIFLEITSRKGHSDTNKHVVEMAKKFDAKLILNTDAHAPNDIITAKELIQVGIDAGLTNQEIDDIASGVRHRCA